MYDQLEGPESEPSGASYYGEEGSGKSPEECVQELKQQFEQDEEYKTWMSNGTTLMHYACVRGHRVVVSALISQGADVNAKENNGSWTPLHWASGNGHETIAALLLENGADKNASCTWNSNDGCTPLHLASENGDAVIVAALLKKEANCNAAMSNGITPLHLASWIGHDAIVTALLDSGADVNAVGKWSNCEGCTPLHLACQSGNERVVRLLLRRGADKSIQDKDSRTPSDVASDEAIAQALSEVDECSLTTEGSEGEVYSYTH